MFLLFQITAAYHVNFVNYFVLLLVFYFQTAEALTQICLWQFLSFLRVDFTVKPHRVHLQFIRNNFVAHKFNLALHAGQRVDILFYCLLVCWHEYKFPPYLWLRWSACALFISSLTILNIVLVECKFNQLKSIKRRL